MSTKAAAAGGGDTSTTKSKRAKWFRRARTKTTTNAVDDSLQQQRQQEQERQQQEAALLRKIRLQKEAEAKQKKAQMRKVKKSWLSRTRFFKNMMDSSFALVDQDGSGDIDEKELYSGLLLIHLKLGTYAGPAACRPISREKCHAVFQKMDSDNSGVLDKEEFEAVMMVLFGNVLMRVAFQYFCTLMIVPLIASYVLKGVTAAIMLLYHTITTLDEHSEFADAVELSLEHVWGEAVEYWHSILPWSKMIPSPVYMMTATVGRLLAAVPASVWATIPLTLVSTILSLMLIPWSFLRIDDYFQRVADAQGGKVADSKGVIKKD